MTEDDYSKMARECLKCGRESAEYWGEFILDVDRSDYVDTPGTLRVFRCENCLRLLIVSSGLQAEFETHIWYIQSSDSEIVIDRSI